MIQYNIQPTENLDLMEPARAEVGISNDLSPNTGMVMGRVTLDSRMRSRRQYFVNADLALFVVNGNGRLETGPAFEKVTDTFESKDFIYIERGEIFSVENLSDGDCTMVYTLVGIEDLVEIEQMHVEDRIT